jgi:hypothetical protein
MAGWLILSCCLRKDGNRECRTTSQSAGGAEDDSPGTKSWVRMKKNDLYHSAEGAGGVSEAR